MKSLAASLLAEKQKNRELRNRLALVRYLVRERHHPWDRNVWMNCLTRAADLREKHWKLEV